MENAVHEARDGINAADAAVMRVLSLPQLQNCLPAVASRMACRSKSFSLPQLRHNTFLKYTQKSTRKFDKSFIEAYIAE